MMSHFALASVTDFKPAPRSFWREYVQPEEHGSWSLALEPVALGLLASPSVGGWWFSVAVIGAFFTRRPLRIFLRDRDGARRRFAARALLVGVGIATAGVIFANATASSLWLAWLIPGIVCGVLFAILDAQGGGRDLIAELAGATSFSTLPTVFAVLAGRPAGDAIALGVVMASRTIPTVLLSGRR